MQLKPIAIPAIAICLLSILYVTRATADSLTYTYDDLNRLKRAQHSDGTVVDYDYDEVGNRLTKDIYRPPVADFSASAYTGNAPMNVTLTDISTGNITSWTWNFDDNSTPGNQQITSHVFETVKTYNVTLTVSNPAGTSTITKSINSQPCQNAPVKILGKPTTYSTLQLAYNQAVSGDTIQVHARLLTDSLNANGNANGNISVSLEGGHVCEFTFNPPGVTKLQGSITTATSGGTLTIRDFILQN